MKLVATVFLYLVLTMVAMPVANAAGEPPALSHNPFSRPPSEVNIDDVSIVESHDGSGPALALRATMVSPANRLANVGGRILKAGDEVRGYELLTIHEDYAVFRKDGKLTTVYVKPQPAEDDE